MDVHYTPQLLAKKLVSAAMDLSPSVVADLCAGRGDLLFQAEAIWPRADYAAVDIDPAAVQRLKRHRTNWYVGRCDVRNPHSRAQSSVLRSIRNRISLLLLNPPFSCRGGKRFMADTITGPIYASAAMSFLITSLSYLHHDGSAIAVLPFGALHNQKDRTAWKYINERYNVSILERAQRGLFPGSSASIALVRLSPLKLPRTNHPPSPTTVASSKRITIRIVRGCLPLFRLHKRSTGPVLVHSTDLDNAEVHFNGRRAIVARRSLTGPAVLIPRVGQLRKEKIAILRTTSPVVLSDCVIGLTTRSLDEARELRNRLVGEFSLLNAQYVGTGAPFVTLSRLERTLASLGIETNAD